MKKHEAKSADKCQKVQDKLLSSPEATVRSEVKDHLTTCRECRQFAAVMTEIPASVNRHSITPDPKVKMALMSQILSGRDHSDSIMNRIAKLMKYRIPAYQAVAAAAVILIIFFVSGKLDEQKNDSFPEYIAGDSLQIFDMKEYKRDSLATVDQIRIGRNVLEDSAITKYMVTAM